MPDSEKRFPETSRINPQRLKKLLHRMIDIYSPSGKEEELLDYLHGVLKRRGLPVLRQKVDDHRYNLLVLPESEIHLCLVGHVDTVTAYELDHYGYVEKGDRILGLGAADMKAGCAAMVEALSALWEGPSPRPPVALALVVGEEEEGDGAGVLADEVHFPWAIIGEPTDLRPCLSSYGYIELQLNTRGIRMHASLAKRDRNPIAAMLGLIMRITTHIESKRPELVYNIRDMFSTRTGFTVPDFCEAWLDVHVPPHAHIGEIVAELEELVETENGQAPRLDRGIRFATIGAGYSLPEKGHMVDALKAIYGQRSLPWEPQPFRSHSDANQLWEAGVRPILLGPGQLERAHAPEESVSFPQVMAAAEIYLDLARALA
jgi:acetylornithine deacetylase